MESRGTTNGAEINAFAINGGNFVVPVPGKAQTAISPTLSLSRRIAARCTAIATVSGASLLTARRRAVATSIAAVTGSLFLVRRAAPKATAAVAVNAGTRLVRRITALSATTIAIRGDMFLSWRYLRRATPNRVMTVQPVRALVVAPELRRLTVPRDVLAMRPSRDRGAMP